MTTRITTREFVRHFARFKRTVAKGDQVVVGDRGGRMFVFEEREARPSLSARLSDLQGALPSGNRKKRLEGFGRTQG
jgi:hypothetical protein